MLSRNEATVQTLRSQYRTAQSAAQEQESKLGELQKSLRSVSAELRSAPRQSESDAVTESLRKLDGSLQEAKNRVETLHDAPQKLAQLKAALSKLGNPQQQAATARAAIARKQNLEAAFERSKSAVTAAERSLGELEGKLAEFAELDSTLDAASHALNTHAAAYQAVLASQQLAQTLAARRQSAAQERNALEQAQKSDEEIGQALAEARRDFDPEAYATLNADAQRLRAEAASLSTQSRMLTEAQTADQRAIAQLEEQALLLTADVERKANLVEQEALLEQLRSVIRQAGPYITSTLISRISEGANQMFGDIMQDYSRYLAWNEDYSITLDVEGTERQFSQLSGGEQMAGALSVRLALLREMSNIDIAFFDEPTTNLDSTRRESLAQQIRNLQGLQQIFVISHDDTFEQDTHNVIRVARVDGASTVVEEW